MERKHTERDKDIVLDRDDAGDVYASLPRCVRHYGVENVDWGYVGPAAAELALNILNWVLPPGVDGEAVIDCEDGKCSAVAWRLHRSFMADFLVRMPYAGGCISEANIRHWVLQHFEVPMETATPVESRTWLSTLMTG